MLKILPEGESCRSTPDLHFAGTKRCALSPFVLCSSCQEQVKRIKSQITAATESAEATYALTELRFDIFDNITSINQHNYLDIASASASHTELRVYHSAKYKQLCKTICIDVGTTIIGYNNQGQIDWQAQGVIGGDADQYN